MYGSTNAGFIPRTAAASWSRSWKAFSPNTSNTISPPDLEEQLDLISNSEVPWREVLRDFWRDFIGAVDDIKDLKISQVIDALDALLAPHLFPPRADGIDPRQCPGCATGRLSLKLSKFGAFIGCSNYPECRYTRPLTAPGNGAAEIATQKLGEDPTTGLRSHTAQRPLWALCAARRGGRRRKAQTRRPAERRFARGCRSCNGRWRCSRCRARSASHPEDGEPIRAGIGRFGPYVQHGKTYANLDNADDVFHDRPQSRGDADCREAR